MHLKLSSSNEDSSDDEKLLRHMERVSLEFLKDQLSSNESCRIGFHASGHNSQDHLHMHLVVPPFKGTAVEQRNLDEVKYGSRLVSIDEVIRRHQDCQDDIKL